MRAIVMREFKSYFTNMIGYVIVAVLCFFFGLFYCMTNLRDGRPYFGSAIGSVSTYLMIIIPILTMRCLSDERKSKTDQLLLTSPASVTEVVLGKYFGMVLVYAIPMLFACLFPLLQAFRPSHSLAIDYTCILALFLIGCMYISVGMFISSLTESQVIAAVLTFLVFFLMYLMSYLTGFIPDASWVNAIGYTLLVVVFALIVRTMTKNNYVALIVFGLGAVVVWALYLVNPEMYYGSVAKVLNIMAFTDGMLYFTNGIMDFTSLVMYLTFIILFIFLTTQSIQKRRWS